MLHEDGGLTAEGWVGGLYKISKGVGMGERLGNNDFKRESMLSKGLGALNRGRLQPHYKLCFWKFSLQYYPLLNYEQIFCSK